MDGTEAIAGLRQGQPIECAKDEWDNGLRAAVQAFAAKMVDQEQTVYAQIALREVKRLDDCFARTKVAT